MRWSKHLAVAVALVVVPHLSAQHKFPEQIGTASIHQFSGGSVGIARGFGFVSGKSSLDLEWIVVTDTTLGIVLDGAVGARGVLDTWFRYAVDINILAHTSVVAFEARVITFNIWREFTGTLSFTQLEDLKPSQRKSFSRVWGIYGESQLRGHFTSIAYIARVRLADGRTIEADPTPALKAAQAVQAAITLQDLLPRSEPIPSFASKA